MSRGFLVWLLIMTVETIHCLPEKLPFAPLVAAKLRRP